MPGVPSWFPGSPQTIGTTSVKNYARSAHAEMADFVEELASLWPKGSLLETAVQSRPLRVARLERIDSPRHRRCYPPPLGSVYELVADVHWDVLRCSLIAVRVCQREAEVEVGGGIVPLVCCTNPMSVIFRTSLSVGSQGVRLVVALLPPLGPVAPFR